jgi:hypothetical protein
MRKTLYHVTSLENVESIKRNGLMCNEEGEIFLFTALEIKTTRNIDWEPLKVPDSIAVNQLGLEKYVLIQIEIDTTGISGKLEADNVAESTAKYQFILKQKRILPKHLRFSDVKIVNYEAVRKWENLHFRGIDKVEDSPY